MTSICAIIVAAGRGSRTGLDGPKQYAKLGGRCVLTQTLQAFEACSIVSAIQVVIHCDDQKNYEAASAGLKKLLPPVVGGATRQASVHAGLNATQTYEHVLIHDAARPFVDEATLRRVAEALNSHQGALPALPVVDSLKRLKKTGVESVDRHNLFTAQTPQGFHHKAITDAHEAAVAEGRHDFTDDAALAQWAGIPVALVEGARTNIKLTTAQDMEDAMKNAAAALPDIRVGHGYDTHILVAGDHVTLCGVKIPHTHSLHGHSDADVGLHALTDALLATIGDGDIGDHFPPSDSKWRGAASDQFLSHAAKLVRKKNGQINHVDVTLLCEEPKIGPHKAAMRDKISQIIKISADRVSVKATTNERVGFIGRQEGIVALATATVVFAP